MEGFRDSRLEVIENAQVARSLTDQGFDLATGGTDNHLILVNLRPHGLSGSKIETLSEAVGLSLNKNAVIGDTSALSPGGVRLGTSALTTQGYDTHDMEAIGETFGAIVELAKMIQGVSGPKLVDFKKAMREVFGKEVEALKASIKEWVQEVRIVHKASK